MICKGYTEANNKFLKLYNARKTKSFIINVEPNNLYGQFVMEFSQPKYLVGLIQKV